MKQKTTSWRKTYAIDIMVVLVILISPFLTFLHLLVDYDSNVFNVLGFSINHGFPENQVFVWIIISHIIYNLYFLLIFLFSNGFWRIFLIPTLFHWVAYPLWLFTSKFNNYFDYIFSLHSLSVLAVLTFIILPLELYIKKKYHQNYIQFSLIHFFKEIFSSRDYRFNKEIGITLKNKSKFTLREYVYRIYYFNSLFHRDNKYSPKKIGINRGRIKIAENLLLSFIVILLTLILFLHYAIPKGIMEMEFIGFRIESFGFFDISTFVFYVSQKFVLCCLVILWFITSNNWWRWAILSPIFFYSYQFWESFQNTSLLESYGNLRVFPLVFLTVLGVFLTSKVIRRISINLDYQEFLEEELDKSLRELSKKGSESRNPSSPDMPQSV